MAVRENDFLLQDRTTTINKMENEYGLITQLGLFTSQGITTRTFQYDQVEDGFALIGDSAWGSERNKYAGMETVSTKAFAVPHFTFDDNVKPSEIQSRRAPGTDAEFDAKDAAVARKLARARRSWGMTKELALAQVINDGTVYAPNGTVVTNYYTELGVTRKEVDFVLGTQGTVVREKGEEVVAHIQDNLQDGSLVTDIVALCNPTFFSKLVGHASYTDAYNNFASSNENGNYLRDRLGVMNGKFRTFRGADGILYIEYRANVKGNPIIPAGECRFMPLDAVDTFFNIYAPADHMDYVNTEGQEMYAWTYDLERGRGVDIETESNFCPFVAKPAVIVRGFSSN